MLGADSVGALGTRTACVSACVMRKRRSVSAALCRMAAFSRASAAAAARQARARREPGGVVGHAGADKRQARAHGRFVQAFAEVDDAVPCAGNFGIDDVRRGAVQNEQPGMRNGHAVQTVRIAGTEVQGRGFAVGAERRMHPPHECGFAHARPAFENQLAPQQRVIHQVVKAGDKALRPHRAGEKGSGGSQKHPSDLADFPTPYAGRTKKYASRTSAGDVKEISLSSCAPR